MYVPTEEEWRIISYVARGGPEPDWFEDKHRAKVERLKAEYADWPEGVSIDLPYD